MSWYPATKLGTLTHLLSRWSPMVRVLSPSAFRNGSSPTPEQSKISPVNGSAPEVIAYLAIKPTTGLLDLDGFWRALELALPEMSTAMQFEHQAAEKSDSSVATSAIDESTTASKDTSRRELAFGRTKDPGYLGPWRRKGSVSTLRERLNARLSSKMIK